MYLQQSELVKNVTVKKSVHVMHNLITIMYLHVNREKNN